MKILLYSDLHIYNHHKLSLNSETALQVLEFIKDFSIKNCIEKIVCAGDFFHTKSRIYAPHVVQSFSAIKEIKNSGISHYMIIGNHDMSNQNTTMNSILFVFSDYAKIIQDYYFIDLDNVRIHFLSYTSNYFDGFILSSSKKNILISHLDIVGFLMSNGVVSNVGFKIEDFSAFDLVFSGHYHKHQKKGNIVYIGSPYQTSFSERDQTKGFIVFDTNTFEWEFIEIKNTPKYKTIDIESLNDLNEKDVYNNFLRINLKNNKIDKSELKRKLIELGVLSVDVILPDDYIELKNNNIEITNDPNELVVSYLNNINDLELDKKKLLKYFHKIQDYSNNITDYEV